MSYRDDRNALEARSAAVERELQELRDRMRELDACAERREALERELFEVRCMLLDIERGAARGQRSPLDDVRVASPCSAAWDKMKGDERVRFCGKCSKTVYDLSAMAHEEAEALLRERSGSLCVRLYRRADGTVLTADCPEGRRTQRRQRLFLAVAGGSAMVAAGVALARNAVRTSTPCKLPAAGYVQGELQMSDPASERTDLFLAASPANATILIDGYPLASNPGIVKFRRDGRAHSVLITAPGYRTRTERVVYDRAEVHLTVALTPDPKAHRRPAR